ncbi:CG10435 [Drosophila busckii]|uniref:CG10435 n=1 Tax=Drosophila busckii TaxID=30019 RepID=A0A0M5J9G9_DROBS|nr:probable basic-leucine zipper transcription factor N isoform X2 [Drosophila busckii]ALC47036.1 CG10435 [Drosophila busckii]
MMDDVPVKIVERYKPPPLVYQLPQNLANRLTQYQSHYYEEQEGYKYDFQLERSVHSQCQHWRQMRQQQQQARHLRQQQRKVERQRALEAKQKEMLGAVEYPNAADLSSGSDDEESPTTTASLTTAAAAATTTTSADTTSISNAESREKPQPKSINSCNFYNILQPTILSSDANTAPTVTQHKRNSSLNYADFEYNMNSTPFDNIELKTINDLDVLAQVLHQTQLTQQASQPVEQQQLKQQQLTEPLALELNVTTLAETKATLDSVNFQVHCDEPQDIPAMYPAPIYSNPTLSQTYHAMGYNQHYYTQALVPQQQQQQLYHNHNYLQHAYATQAPPVPKAVLCTPESDSKSKSVPDILRELKSELQQAEKRRARLHSHNENVTLTLPQEERQQMQSINDNSYQELAVPAQNLAQRISSMGFPLDRVAKVVSLCGIDDKKIIEHLIPLGELMDLGFDETKISAALLKFDNNKEKALDYLIN